MNNDFLGINWAKQLPEKTSFSDKIYIPSGKNKNLSVIGSSVPNLEPEGVVPSDSPTSLHLHSIFCEMTPFWTLLP